MKKIFGGLSINWKVVIFSSIIIGVLVGLLNSIPVLKDTSFTDSAIYFDLWILFGILIIMNSKSAKDSALKCFVFFLISQPLIYLVEVPFSPLGFQLFRYYRYWFYWTILCLPMGFIGHYIKKDKWWGLFILMPMMLLLGYSLNGHLGNVVYAFPRHLLSFIFCCVSVIIYPLGMFNNKKVRLVGLTAGLIIIIGFTIMVLIDRPVYETDVLCTGGTYNAYFDNSYSVQIKNPKYGEVSIKNYSTDEPFYCVHAIFKKAGKTELIVTSPDNESKIYILKFARTTYDIEIKE